MDFREFTAGRDLFDHDLVEGPSGMDAAKWLTEQCLATNRPLPTWNIQTANPIGKQNISSLLTSYEKVHGKDGV